MSDDKGARRSKRQADALETLESPGAFVRAMLMRRELTGLALLFGALFLFIALATFSADDPSFNHAVSGRTIQNGAGRFGAYIGAIFVDVFGVGAYLWPFFLLLRSAIRFVEIPKPAGRRRAGLWLLYACLLAFSASDFAAKPGFGEVAGGGYIGSGLHFLGTKALGGVGGFLIWFGAVVAACQLIVDLTWREIFEAVKGLLREIEARRAAYLAKRAAMREELERFAKRARPEARVFEEPAPLALFPDRFKAKSTRPALRDAEPKALPGAAPNSASEVLEEEEPVELSPALAILADDYADLPESAHDLVPKAPAAPSFPAREHDGENIPEVPAVLVEAMPETAEQFVPEPETAPPSRAARNQAPIPKRIEPPKTELLGRPLTAVAPPAPEKLRGQAEALIRCLNDFGVSAEVVRVSPGPVVTMFELKPAPGVKISKIVGLSDDLSLALKALAVRIEAPIAGSDTVGVEIPNEARQTVHLREVLEADDFAKAESLLTFALGKDISGRPKSADLAKMPHLLVAGATGAGKSVCLNSILLSFLFKAKPDQLKLLLVDPKRIELSVYDHMPHLVHPVVTEMAHAKNALDWAIREMDSRYEAMATLGVRNIEGYNQRLKNLPERDRAALLDSGRTTDPMPFLVIVIDELADLMLTAGKEAELCIVRLAQLARAAGIHMILATQRPSVDVVTGLIKANFPCRISFQVTSKHDSRTILDAIGSEKLLGKGDMLFKPSGGKMTRLHGCFVPDEDVARVVDYWKALAKPNYHVDFASEAASDSGESGESFGGDDSDVKNDPKYAEAVDFVLNQGKASISLIQRRFRIGFNRAARFVEQMEADGVVGRADAAGKPRPVLTGRE